jgi:4-alpha-glucanotransferase
MTPAGNGELRALRRLARRRGVQTSYYDVLHRRVSPPPETLLAVLRALGEPLETFRDAKEALRAATESGWDRLCPPVCVSWDGGPAELELHVPAAARDDRARIMSSVEGGGERVAECDLSSFPVTGSGRGSSGERVAIRVPLPWSLPHGYHVVRVETRDGIGSTTVISAPLRAWAPEGAPPANGASSSRCTRCIPGGPSAPGT